MYICNLFTHTKKRIFLDFYGLVERAQKYCLSGGESTGWWDQMDPNGTKVSTFRPRIPLGKQDTFGFIDQWDIGHLVTRSRDSSPHRSYVFGLEGNG